jgi:hypothetical protein
VSLEMLWMLMIFLEGECNPLYTTCRHRCSDSKLSHTQAFAIASCRRLGRMALNQVSKREDADCDTKCTDLEVRAETMLVERSSRWIHYGPSRQDPHCG